MLSAIPQSFANLVSTGSAVADAVISSGIFAWAVATLWSLTMAPAQVAVMEGGRKVGIRTVRRASSLVTNLVLRRHVRSSVRGLIRIVILALVASFALPVIARSLPEAMSTIASVLHLA